MRLFLDETHARGAHINILPVRTFDFLERRVLVPQAIGRLAVLILQ